ncbi:unannotated protein [freshwater metagenome]|uniref:Unannotated protein n=1 Tax=freshwater metagenome TaxID=449393 RepID=A0A6J7XSL4_9ZZZZ|nr:TSUP family transporter [Actinomycetota bacterium]
MFVEVSTLTLVALALAAFCAGLVDAIAGGGGLIQLPALLIGLPNASTVEILGTNKSASVFGTSASALLYRRSVKTEVPFLIAMSLPAFVGSTCGASLASKIPTESMRPIVFVLLVAVGIYTWKRPHLGAIESLRHNRERRFQIAAVAGLVVGFYDGIFGPGTGSFLMLVLVSMGFAFLSASAIAKVVNVSTNLGAILVFGIHGAIIWKIALVLACANITGGIVGSRLAIRGGSALVRKFFLVVTFALILKVGIDTFLNW